MSIWSRGIDHDRFNPQARSLEWRRSLGIQDDEVVVGFLGRLVLEKGLDIFADVVNELARRAVKHRVMVVGKGPAQDWFAERVPEAIFTGFQSGDALSQAVANRCFIPQRSGNIIVIASTAALRAGMQMKAVAYYSSKAAALHLTRALAGEWGQYNIRVNAICPGFFPSKMASGVLDSMMADVIARTPLGRIGGDTDLQGAAVYLASDASRHVTGQYIAVDGGASAV